MPARLETTLEPTARETLVRLEGPLDLAQATFLRELLSLLAESSDRPVVIDLSRVAVIDSVGIGVLIAADRRFRENGVELRVRCPHPPIFEVLELSGLTGQVTVER
jgi:anti-anti-sigma factor